MSTVIIGVGKIGLPLANLIASKGLKVIGYDIDAELIGELNAGMLSRVFEPGLSESVKKLVRGGLLSFTTNLSEAMRHAKTIVVVVPLYVDHDLKPDFSLFDKALKRVGQHLSQGALVTIETTVPVGTTRNRAGAILSKNSGLRVGDDFLLAFSPERVSSGTFDRDMSYYPKLVGGVNTESTEAAARFYESFIGFTKRDDLNKPNGVWRLGSSESAEFTKLAETTYRDVNIALANTFGKDARDNNLDIWEILEAANSQPFSHIHSPGISVGGHCIPVYPHLYNESSSNNELISVARKINKGMPVRAVKELERKLGSLSGLRICIFGISYRPGVKESAFSGAYDLRNEIEKQGGIVLAIDPLYTRREIKNLGFTPFELGSVCDGVILHSVHPSYENLELSDFDGLRIILTTRGESLFDSDKKVEKTTLF